MTLDYQPGAVFGQYTLERRLGAGGFGDVWLGRRTDGLPVAIKLLKASYSSAEAVRLRADVELLAAAAASDSSHIVRVLGGGIEPAPHVVMEYIEGTDLASEIARNGGLSVERVLPIARGLASALTVLESADIIHRDVKPANVMLDASGVAKLTDFGIAKIVGMDDITTIGQLPMSTAYSAPEVWEGRPSHQSDLYAFGALLFHCLAGRQPYLGTLVEVYHQHVNAAPDLALLPGDTPRSLRDLTRACLAKDAGDRPASAQAVLTSIAAAEREFAAAIDLAEQTVHLPRAFGPWLRRAPHPTRPWTFLCAHSTTGEAATVEVHFSDSAAYGNLLRAAVEANPRLVDLGAERLLGTSRLVLRPDETWASPPPGRFQFWVAREEFLKPDVARQVTVQTSEEAAEALLSLIEEAELHSLRLNLDPENISLDEDGLVHLLRPALPPFPAASMEDQALAWLDNLPLLYDTAAPLEGTNTSQALAESGIWNPFGFKSAGSPHEVAFQPTEAIRRRPVVLAVLAVAVIFGGSGYVLGSSGKDDSPTRVVAPSATPLRVATPINIIAPPLPTVVRQVSTPLPTFSAPPATPRIAITTTTAQDTYTVVPGDSLPLIAEKQNVPPAQRDAWVQAVRILNNMQSDNMQPGQVLRLPPRP